ncbi:MAG: hypothetical protein VKL42_01420 [Snowella sp.]|nr:hypothetical protein [Snowella sp.]
MKKLSITLSGVLVSACCLGMKTPAYAHGIHWGSFHVANSPSQPYLFVTPTGSNIDTNFLTNPNIGTACAGGSTPSLNCDSLTLNIPRLREEISNTETTSTFQPSQGLYQNVATLGKTGNTFDAFEFVIPPEATTTFHSHQQGWEFFYVVGGDPANNGKSFDNRLNWK